MTDPMSDTTDQANTQSAATEGAAPETTETLKAELEATKARLAAGEERVRELQERQLRVAAEFDNFRKRAVREREETTRAANERLLKEMLPVVDNLERAMASGGDQGALVEGVRLVHRQFVDALARFGVQSFVSAGEKFDPARHEALMEQETDAVPAGHVVSEMVKGYMLHDRLLRAASVVVAKARVAAAAQ